VCDIAAESCLAPLFPADALWHLRVHVDRQRTRVPLTPPVWSRNSSILHDVAVKLPSVLLPAETGAAVYLHFVADPVDSPRGAQAQVHVVTTLSRQMLPLVANESLRQAGTSARASKTRHVLGRVVIRCLLDQTMHPAALATRTPGIPVPLVAPGRYGRVCYTDDLANTRSDWVLAPGSQGPDVDLELTGISVGWFRVLQHFGAALHTLQHQFGLTEKELDDVKQLLSAGHAGVLALTYAVTILHTVLEGLAFKNEVQFYRHRKSFVGLSKRALVMNLAFGLVIFLYLYDSGEVCTIQSFPFY
jgi:hypothetical protein